MAIAAILHRAVRRTYHLVAGTYVRSDEAVCCAPSTQRGPDELAADLRLLA
jgi:hypothetical protein